MPRAGLCLTHPPPSERSGPLSGPRRRAVQPRPPAKNDPAHSAHPCPQLSERGQGSLVLMAWASTAPSGGVFITLLLPNPASGSRVALLRGLPAHLPAPPEAPATTPTGPGRGGTSHFLLSPPAELCMLRRGHSSCLPCQDHFRSPNFPDSHLPYLAGLFPGTSTTSDPSL